MPYTTATNHLLKLNHPDGWLFLSELNQDVLKGCLIVALQTPPEFPFS